MGARNQNQEVNFEELPVEVSQNEIEPEALDLWPSLPAEFFSSCVCVRTQRCEGQLLRWDSWKVTLWRAVA